MTNRPTQSFTALRQFTEKWQWTDPRTGLRAVGYVHPPAVRDLERHPFFIRFLTKTGHVDEGQCVCLSVNPLTHQRRVQFVESGEIRMVNDILVIEVDGTRFVTH